MDTNVLINNESLTRAIHLARVGRFGICVLFQADVSLAQRNAVNHFVGQHCTHAPVGLCHIAVEYCVPDADSYMNKKDDKRPNVYWERAMSATPVPLGRVSIVLDHSCDTLLKTAYDRLEYEPVDVEKVLQIAQCAALVDGSSVIRIEHLAEAIHYRSFDRELLVKDGRSWTADQILEILGTMAWTDQTARKWLDFEDADNLTPHQEIEYEAIMWGWQGALEKHRENLGLIENIGDFKKPPSTTSN